MLRNDPDRKAAKAVGKALLALLAIVVFFTLPLPSVSIPAIPHPDLPGIPGWLATILMWGKFAVLAVLAGLVVAGAIEERGQSADEDGSAS